MDQFTYSFSTRLKAARELRGMSQADLAEAAGLPAASISHFERGARLPSIQNFRALADALDADASWLLFLRPDPVPSARSFGLVQEVDTMSERDQRIVRQIVQVLRDESLAPRPPQ